jgi:hypothetical protein
LGWGSCGAKLHYPDLAVGYDFVAGFCLAGSCLSGGNAVATIRAPAKATSKTRSKQKEFLAICIASIFPEPNHPEDSMDDL